MDSEPHSPQIALPAWISRWLERPGLAHKATSLALLAAGLLTILSALTIALCHFGDRWGINHVAGAWMGLTASARSGLWYPPLYDGHRWAGTRFMVLGIAYDVLLASMTGEYLTSSKLAAFISIVLLLVVSFLSLRRVAVPRPLALAFAACVLSTEAGVIAVSSSRGDVMPVVLQLSALLLLLSGKPSLQRAGASGALAGLAVLAKMSALWALPAAFVYLLLRDKKRAGLFLAVGLLVIGCGVLSTNALTDGRFLQNLTALSGSGLSLRRLLGAPGKLHYLLLEGALVAWALLPLVAFSLLRSLAARRLSLFQLAWLASLPLLLVILADTGTFANHLLDFIVLSALVAGEGLAPELAGPVPTPLGGLGVLLLLLALAAGFDRRLSDELRDSLRGRNAEALVLDPFEGKILPDDPFLSEDPTLAVMLGQMPVVLDAWMFLRRCERQPELAKPLVDRIEAGDFRWIVLLFDPEKPEARIWYRDQAFGLPVLDAVLNRYERVEVKLGYHLYQPKGENENDADVRLRGMKDMPIEPGPLDH